MRRKWNILMSWGVLIPAGLVICSGCVAGTDLVCKAHWDIVEAPSVPVPKDVLPLAYIPALPKDPAEAMSMVRARGRKLAFSTYPNGGDALLPSWAYVAFSETHFLALLEGEQGEGYELQAHPQEVEDGHIWQDDNFEVFVDPFLSRAEYVHFIVNPLGDVFDQLCLEKRVPDPKAADPSATMPIITMDRDYASGASVPVVRNGSRWSALFSLPYSAFGLTSPPMGQVWGFNFCHTNRENSELSQWRSTPGKKGFHQPMLFGALRFGGADSLFSTEFRLPLSGAGGNVIHADIENRGKRIEAHSRFRLIKNRKELAAETTTEPVLSPGHSTHEIQFGIPPELRGPYRITLEISAGDDPVAYFVKNVAFTDPVLLTLPLDQIYTTDPSVDGHIRFSVGEQVIGQKPLEMELVGPDGFRKTQRLGNLKGNYIEFSLSMAGLKPGNYVLSVIVPDIGKAEKAFYVMSAPFDF